MKKKIELEVPTVPNFVRIKGTDTAVSVAAFSEAECRELGREWTNNLIKRAAVLRDQQKKQSKQK